MMPPMQNFVGQVSVVIPMYNSEKTIVDALESIRKQTRLDYVKQIIVVNDGSIDSSLDVVKNYAETHKDLPIEVIDQENGGVSVARNRGMDRATGEWIAFLDADDEWLPCKLERQVQVLINYPEIDFLGANFSNGPIRFGFRKYDGLFRISFRMFFYRSFLMTPSVVMKRKIYEEKGGFVPEYRHGEDVDYWLRICGGYNAFFMTECLVSIGQGKHPFGDSGLTADLQKMHMGVVRNLESIYQKGYMSFFEYLFWRVWIFLKHLRRLLIVFRRKS